MRAAATVGVLFLVLLGGCLDPSGTPSSTAPSRGVEDSVAEPAPVLNVTLTPSQQEPGPAPAPVPNATVPAVDDAPAETSPVQDNQTVPPTSTNTTAATTFYNNGTYEVLVQQGSLQRRFIHYVPSGLKVGEPVPLLVLLHGGTGTPENMIWKTGLQPLADAQHFRILAPEATPNAKGEPRWQAWESRGLTDTPVDDVTFILDAVAWMQHNADINASRIGVAGHSEGGAMAYAMGGSNPALFRFIAPVAGLIGQRDLPARPWHNITSPGQPVNALIIHATDDPQIPYDGGRGRLDPWVTKASVAAGIALFTTPLGSWTTTIEDEGETQIQTYRGTDTDYRVVHVRTVGGHGWPGGFESSTFPYNLLVETPPHPDASALVVEWLVGDLP